MRAQLLNCKPLLCCGASSLFGLYIFVNVPLYLLQIILSQEKNIQRLNELVRSLRGQLLQCRNNNETMKGPVNALTENVIELERQHVLED